MVRKLRQSSASAGRDPLDAVRRRLARRPLTAAEAAALLRERGMEEVDVDEMMEGLRQEGWLDDARLAEGYLSARAERMGHGPLRLLRELEERGVARATAERIWRRLVETGDVDPDAILARRLEARLAREESPLDPAAAQRIYTTLLRAGFDPGTIRASLRPHMGDGSSAPRDGAETDQDDDAIC